MALVIIILFSIVAKDGEKLTIAKHKTKKSRTIYTVNMDKKRVVLC